MVREVKVESKCSTCKHQISEAIPPEMVEMMERCGTNESLMRHIYTSQILNNSWFSNLGSVKCDLCGKRTVLVWFDGCSPAGCNVISPPSARVSYYPMYDYPTREVFICKFCMPKSGEDNAEFMDKLITAIKANNSETVEWQKTHKRKFP